MSENLATILALLGGIAASAATIITAVKRVGAGNYATVVSRMEAQENLSNRQSQIIIHLSNWQLTARETIRTATNEIVNLGGTLSPRLRGLLIELERDLPLDPTDLETESEKGGS
ncbi:membrane protein [Rhodococcus phage MacGully]|nr:membrane protein [Rhodococcus phage MacGully]